LPIAERIQLWLEGLSFWEFPFCLLALLIGAGLMRPVLPMMRIGPAEPATPAASTTLHSPLFVALRNIPVDYVAHRYNARVVASGYPHPSVMIAVKPINDEGVLPLLSLTECRDDIIRVGVLALLAKRQAEIENNSPTHWTEFQGSHALLKRRLKKQEAKWQAFKNEAARNNAIAEFRHYAMQWY
jgi:hypothetical protein